MKTTGRVWRARTALALIALLAAGGAVAQGTQPAVAPPAQADTAPAPQQKLYGKEQLDQMLAPVALYPDSVLSQLLMACTYPGDVAEAAKWSAAHKDTKGDAAVNQVENEQWDPSVKSLVAFPQVLDQLAKQPDWVQKTGDAFLAQPQDVMDSIQRLRQQAQKAGNLKSNEQQKVVVKDAPAAQTQTTTQTQPAPTSTTNTTVIEIQPSNPETVYVPAYNPTTVYGTWAYPSYPPPYWPPSPYYYPGYVPGAALMSGIAFGIGVAAVGSCWGSFGWGHGDVDINVNKYNNINRNNQISNSGNRGNGNQKWSHNSQNRRGTPYADSGSRQKFDQGRGGAENRSGYRGDASRDASRQRAQQSFNSSTGFQGGNREGAGNRGGGANAGNRAGGANAGANRAGGGSGNLSSANRGGGGNTARPSSASSRSSAFSGASSPGSSQREMSRGQSSQRSMASSGGRGSGGGHQTSRSAPSRGGGGARGGGGGGRRR